jgi:thiamine pyrophosphokinase
MTLPDTLKNNLEWVLLGPMGPELPSFLSTHPLIGVDGGAQFAKKLNIWVGDADSFTKKVEADHFFKFSTQKGLSDLALALDLLKMASPKILHLWGFLGGRKDHELFNLGEGLHFLENKQNTKINFYNSNGELTYLLLSTGLWKFKHSGLFSLGTLKKTKVKLTGQCLYQLPNPHSIEALSSLGLSNESQGEVELETEGPIFIYFESES